MCNHTKLSVLKTDKCQDRCHLKPDFFQAASRQDFSTRTKWEGRSRCSLALFKADEGGSRVGHEVPPVKIRILFLKEKIGDFGMRIKEEVGVL